MEWLRVDSGFPGHPKLGPLARALGVSRAAAGWALVRLWCWVAQHRESGDLSGIEAADLCEAIGLDTAGDDAETCVEHLVATGWLDRDPDGTLRVHEWLDRQGRMLRERDRVRAVREQRKAAAAAEGTIAQSTCAQNAYRTRTERVLYGRPDQTRPDQTRPDQTRPDQTRPDQTRPTDTAEGVALEHPSAPPAGPLLTFDCAGKTKTWDLTERHVAVWSSLFPDVDVMKDLRLAQEKIRCGAVAKKTASGMPKFCLSWLGRTQDRCRPSVAGLRQRPREVIEAELERLQEAFRYDPGADAYHRRREELRVELARHAPTPEVEARHEERSASANRSMGDVD